MCTILNVRYVQVLNSSVYLLSTLTQNKSNTIYTICRSKRSRFNLKIFSLSGRDKKPTLETTAHLVDIVD